MRALREGEQLKTIALTDAEAERVETSIRYVTEDPDDRWLADECRLDGLMLTFIVSHFMQSSPLSSAGSRLDRGLCILAGYNTPDEPACTAAAKSAAMKIQAVLLSEGIAVYPF